MKTTSKFIQLNAILVAVALVTAAFAFIMELHGEARQRAVSEQERYLKTFKVLLADKGKDIHIRDGKLLAGGYLLNGNNELPDAMQSIFGCTATIFMGNTRIATSVRYEDGRRALGTRLEGPAFDAVFKQGRPYHGEANILGVPYFTAYVPLKDKTGAIIGALYVGVKKSDYLASFSQLKTKVVIVTILLILLFSFFAILLVRMRKKVDAEIVESDERFRVAFEAIPDALCIYSLQDGTGVDINPGFTSLTGYSREEVLRRPILDRDIWADTKDYESFVASMREQGVVSNLETRLRHKDGPTMHVSVSAKIISLRNESFVFGVIRDISERKKSEARLHRTNQTLKTLLKCNEILVRAEKEADLLHDICSIIVENDHYLLAWVGYAENDEKKTIRPVAQEGYEDGYLESLQLTWDDKERGRGPSGTAIRTGMPSVMRDMWNDPHYGPWREQALKRGYRSSLAVPLATPTSILGCLNIYSSQTNGFDEEEIGLMVQLAQDLAYGIISLQTLEKHKRTTEALWESAREYQALAAEHDRREMFLRALLDSIPDLIFFKNSSSAYLGCNKAFEAFAGKKERELIGLTDLDLFPREVAEFFREMDRQMMSHRKSRRNEEWVDYPDGRRILLDTLKTPFYDAEGNVLGLIGISRDITQQKHHDEEKKILESQLHQAQKMEAIGQLAGGIAHDFNNILTAIIGYSEIISLKLEKSSPLRKHLEQVLIAAERASELTNGLLAFSRKQVLHTKPLDLCQVVKGMKKMLRRLIPEDIDFKTDVSGEVLTVLADKGQIEQVLMNLVTNAKDAMPKGGTLSLEVASTTINETFLHAHGFGEPGSYAVITVSDTGHGMSRETLEKIFEPFFTTKETGKGTGLGMAIIYGIVKQHNGYITVESEPEKGTKFTLYLPLVVELEQEERRAVKSEVSPHGTETILLVEDDDTVRELHRMMLEEAGYQVITATDGQDALEKFGRRQSDVALLVTDVIMPRMDGKRLFEEIRAIRHDIRVLFISGYTKDVFVERGILDEEFSFIMKPVSSSTLLAGVREALDR